MPGHFDRCRCLRATIVAVLLSSTRPATAMFLEHPRPQVPVQRLARNLEAKLAADPTDIATRFQLARVHTTAA